MNGTYWDKNQRSIRLAISCSLDFCYDSKNLDQPTVQTLEPIKYITKMRKVYAQKNSCKTYKSEKFIPFKTTDSGVSSINLAFLLQLVRSFTLLEQNSVYQKAIYKVACPSLPAC